jgi:hypothetical protein
MAISIDALSAILERMELEHLKVDDEQILLGGTVENELLKLIIRVSGDGEYVVLHTFDFATFEPHEAGFDAAMRIINEANLRYNLVALSWDPEDGEIVAGISFPCADRPVTELQLGLALVSLTDVCRNIGPQFERARRERSIRPPERLQRAQRRSSTGRGSQVAFSIGVLLLGIAALLYTAVSLWK